MLSKKVCTLILSLLGFISSPLYASPQVVTNTLDSGAGSLRNAIIGANAPGDTITFAPTATGTISLGSDLPLLTNPNLNIIGNGQVDINGNGHLIFFVQSGSTSISNLFLQGGLSQGGSASQGGGGGALGAGGALFVNSGATATISQVSFLTNTSIGGAGGSAGATNAAGGSGGGGFNQAAGGTAAAGTSGGGGGGFGIGGSGGAAAGQVGGGGGGSLGFPGGISVNGGGDAFGGGGGAGTAGAGGNSTQTNGGLGGAGAVGSVPGTGGVVVPTPGVGNGTQGNAGTGSAGGGGGGTGNSGGLAGGNGGPLGGGGGGGGAEQFFPALPPPQFGGTAGNGGNAPGFGSGGGGGGFASGPNATPAPGGSGGNAGAFGGGGGGGPTFAGGQSGGAGGTSAFGGGGGGGGGGPTAGAGGAGGFGGGNGGTPPGISGNGGGGGSAFGGAVFVRSGGSLILADGVFTSNSVTAGIGGGPTPGGTAGANGIVAGNDLFLMNGSLATVSVGSTLTIDIGGLDPNNVLIGGSLTKTGLGTLFLTTATVPTGLPSAYTGNLIVNGGNLTLGTITPASVAANIASQATVTNASMTVSSNSALVHAVAFPTSGNVSLISGRLLVQGTVGGTVSVDAGSILQGTGNVVGNITSSGIVEPGPGIATLTYANNFTQNANGTTRITINGAGGTSVLSGPLGTSTATVLGGTLNVIPLPGQAYLKGTTYNFLTAAGGVTGTMTQITGLGGVQARINRFPTFLQLELLQNIIGPVQLGKNAGVVQRYLENITITPGSDLADVVALLNTLTVPQLADALERLSPAQFDAIGWATASLFSRVTPLFAERGDLLCSCEVPKCVREKKFALWFEKMYDNLDQKLIQQLQGFRARSNGTFAGCDYAILQNLIVGIGGGYTSTHLDWKQSHGNNRIRTGYLGVYSSFYANCFKINASYLGGWQKYNNERTIIFPGLDRTAESNYKGKAQSVHLGVQRNIGLNNGLEVSPYGAVDYIYVCQNPFSETGALSLDLDVRENIQTFLRSELGVAVVYPLCFKWGTVIPKGRLSWVCLDPLTGGRVTSNFTGIPADFTVNTAKKEINQVAPGLEVTVWMKNGLCAGINYQGQFSDEICDQEISGSLSWRF